VHALQTNSESGPGRDVVINNSDFWRAKAAGVDAVNAGISLAEVIAVRFNATKEARAKSEGAWLGIAYDTIRIVF
jgi:hypothetical protein